MISWATAQTLLVILGPQIYRFGKKLYTSARNPGQPQPLPRTSAILLNILFVSAVLAILSTFPRFMPENVFQVTDTRLTKSSTDVVFLRLGKIRPLTAMDELLKEKIKSKETRLYYAAYGPDPLLNCLWCTSNNASDYFRYLLPGVAAVHLLHMFVIGIVTSSTTINNPDGAYFRSYAVIACVLIAAAETWALATFNTHSNANAVMPQDVKWRFWDCIFYRGIALAVVDALLGYGIYLSATQRIDLGIRTNPVENVQVALLKLQYIESKLSNSKEVRNVSMKDPYLRGKVAQFWDDIKKERQNVLDSEDAATFRETMFQSPEGRDVDKMTKKKAKHIIQPLRHAVQGAIADAQARQAAEKGEVAE